MSESSQSESSDRAEDLNTTVICNNPTKKKRGRTNSADPMLLALQSMENRLASKIESSIEALANRMDAKIDSFAARLDNKIDSVERDLTLQITTVSSFVESKIKEMAPISVVTKIQDDFNKLQKMQKHTESILDKIERESLLTRLIVSGLPYVENEDLCKIFENIAMVIGCGSSVAGAYRAKTSNTITTTNAADSSLSNNSTSVASSSCIPNDFTRRAKSSKGILSPPIIIKFDTSEKRFDFYQHYFKFKQLNLKHIGFNTASRIYINELLTKKNSEIFRMVRNLKARDIISRYHTSRGVVYVYKIVNDALVASPIFDKEQLSTFG